MVHTSGNRVRSPKGRPENHSIDRRKIRGLDLEVTPVTSETLVRLVRDVTEAENTLLIANVNLHGLYMYETDSAFREFTDHADLCIIDGWPILKMVHGRRLSSRYKVASQDWLRPLLEDPAVRIAAIGGCDEASALAAANVRSQYKATWRGVPGYSLEERQEEVAAAISESNVVIVGLGMPIQERWILENRELLKGKVVANVGGCIDRFAGLQKDAPRFVANIGLEWLLRLLADPRRFAYRYLAEPLLLVAAVLRRHARLRFGPAVGAGSRAGANTWTSAEHDHASDQVACDTEDVCH